MGGAFKINNNAVVVSKAVVDCIAYGTPVEDTIRASESIFDFQIIAKTWAKCGNAVHEEFGAMEEVQRVNRVYAVEDYDYGTLYQVDPDTGNYRKVSGLPAHVLVDNDNHMTLDKIDRDWYIRLAKRYVNDFFGIKPRKNGAVTRKINKKKKELLAMLEIANGSTDERQETTNEEKPRTERAPSAHVLEPPCRWQGESEVPRHLHEDRGS